MNPISSWTATGQLQLKNGEIILERDLCGYKLECVLAEYCLWIVAHWQSGVSMAFRVAFAANDTLTLVNMQEGEDEIVFSMQGATGNINVKLSFPAGGKPMFRYTTTMTPAFDMLIPYWPRDIMPYFKDGNTEDTQGRIHASQIGSRSGALFMSMDKPGKASVFYFQNLTALNLFCEDTETSAGDLVGGVWPEVGMKLPETSIEKPLKEGVEYCVSDAFVVLSDVVPGDNYEMAKQYLDYMADVYVLIPRPETQYHDWIDILHKGLNDLDTHKGCWQFADGRSYLNAYVSDYDTPPESMVQLAVLLPLIDYDKWSGEDHHPVIQTLHEGLENFYDKNLGTVVRWLPAKEDKLDYSEEQKRPDVMDSWYLHHPLLNLSRLALDGDKAAKKLLLDSIDYVIKVAHNFNYDWPVFYKMATLEVLKAETQEGQGGEKDVPGAYAHLMIQVWQLTKDKKYFDEAVKAARKLDGLGFDVFYQANNTAFSAGALMRLYKETNDEVFLNLSYLCIAAILKNVQLWECKYGNAKNYPTFFACYPLKDAPYTAAYEEQEVFSGIHTFLKEAEDVEILPSVKLLLGEFVKYIINRVSYYYPPRLPREVLAEREDVKTGEIDPNLWIALEDLQDGWNRSGQVGQEVYGAGIAFGIMPRQYLKMKEAGFIVFTEYPVEQVKKSRSQLSFRAKGSEQFCWRMMVIALQGHELPDVKVAMGMGKQAEEVHPLENDESNGLEYMLRGNTRVVLSW